MEHVIMQIYTCGFEQYSERELSLEIALLTNVLTINFGVFVIVLT